MGLVPYSDVNNTYADKINAYLKKMYTDPRWTPPLEDKQGSNYLLDQMINPPANQFPQNPYRDPEIAQQVYNMNPMSDLSYDMQAKATPPAGARSPASLGVPQQALPQTQMAPPQLQGQMPVAAPAPRSARSQLNVWDLLNQKDPDVERLRALQDSAIEDQRNTIAKQQSDIVSKAKFDPQTNLAPLLGLIDQWSGSKLAHSYVAPESGQERLDKIAALERGIAGEGKDLSKSQLDYLKSAIGDKRDVLKNKLAYMMHNETLQNARDIEGMKTANAQTLENMKLGGKNGTKQLPAAQERELADLKSLYETLEKNHEQWKKMATKRGSYLLGAAPNTEANTYESLRKGTGTIFGKQMMQKATDAGIRNHIDLIEGKEDDIPKGEAKYQSNRQKVRDKYNGLVNGYRNGKFDLGTNDVIGASENKSVSDNVSREEMLKVIRGK